MRSVIFSIGFGLAVGAVACGAGDETSSESGPPSSASGTAGGSGVEAFEVTPIHSDPSIAVNAYLVSGKTDAILVDSAFFQADAEALVESVKASGKTLRQVFLTHAHPDHYLGFQALAKAFPDAEFVATKAVVDDFRASAPAVLAGLKLSPVAKQIADALVTPEALPGDTLELEGEPIDVFQIPEAGESPASAALVLAAPKALIGGDLLYGKAHLYLAECHADGWKANLEAAGKLGLEQLYPGHGIPGGPEILATDAAYIDAVMPILDQAATSEDALGAITKAYPDWTATTVLSLSVQRYFADCK